MTLQYVTCGTELGSLRRTSKDDEPLLDVNPSRHSTLEEPPGNGQSRSRSFRPSDHLFVFQRAKTDGPFSYEAPIYFTVLNSGVIMVERRQFGLLEPKQSDRKWRGLRWIVQIGFSRTTNPDVTLKRFSVSVPLESVLSNLFHSERSW